MPTRQQWLDSLYTDYQVTVSSSTSLISGVQTKQAERRSKYLKSGKIPPDMKPAVAVINFQPDVPVNIKPIELLLSIGLITSSPVLNLADICSTWAIVRYVWAFQPQNNSAVINPLKLSKEARTIDFHQKALLSDEIGIGFAHFLMVNYLNANNPADVSLVLEKRQYNLYRKVKIQPDYIFFDETSGAKYVVECKGTQTSRAKSLDQIRRGTEQVWSIQPSDSQALTRLIIATCMQKKKTVVYIVDPPSDDIPAQDSMKNSKEERTLYLDGKPFRRDTRLIGKAKLLAYAGLVEEAYGILPDMVRKRLTFTKSVGKSDAIETEFGDYDGTTISVDYRDGTRLAIFRGISRQLRETLMKTGKEDVKLTEETEPSEFLKGYDSSLDKKGGITEVVNDDKNSYVRSLSRDGAMLEIRVSE